MAGHTYRAWLWHQSGFALWNAQWYGGHHVAGYSLLYPPLAAVAGTRLVGVVAAGAPGLLFPPPSPPLGGPPPAGAPAPPAVPPGRPPPRRARWPPGCSSRAS